MTCTINGNTNGPCPTYSFNSANNQITNTGYTYDAAGDLTDDTYHSYQWNAEGRMTSVDNGSTETRAFNAVGEFAQININGAAAEFLYTPSGHMLGVNCSGAWCEQYLPFGGRDLGYYDGPMLFLHANNIGSTTMRTTGTGAVEGDILEEPWGQNWQYLGTQRVDEDFAGFGHVDQFTWTYFTLHRAYNPSEGRWLTPDLLGGDIANPQSLNRYAYALNNPTTLTDPSGLDSCTINGQPGICVTSTSTSPDQLPFYIGPCSYEAIEFAACYGGSSPAPPGWVPFPTSAGTSTPPAPKPNIIPWSQLQALVHANNQFSEPNESDNYCDDVVDCIVMKESTRGGGFNTNMVPLNKQGQPIPGATARGLMGVTVGAATDVANQYAGYGSPAALHDQLFNPAINIQAGSDYLNILSKRWGGLTGALNHYGPGDYADEVKNCVQDLQRGAPLSVAEEAAHGH